MTKPREKTRVELTAQIEAGKKMQQNLKRKPIPYLPNGEK